MNISKFILLFIISVWGLLPSLQAQQKKPSKINDIFFQYVSKTLALQPAEADRMRPIVKTYLTERKKILANYKDPLEREQQILNLKKVARQRMVKVVGIKKANLFFTSEQTFRRKVREELKNRKQGEKKNDV